MKISTEDAIRILRNYTTDRYRPDIRQAHRMGIEALREREERRWISASEPPKTDEPVLVCTKHRRPFKARYVPERGRWDVSHSVQITHWMPLPEGPGEME